MYQNEEVLWTTTLHSNPASWMSHNNLGILLDDKPGRSDEAIFHYEEALRLGPENAKAHSNLARDLGRIPGRQAEAIAHGEAALRIDPSLGWAHSFTWPGCSPSSPAGRRRPWPITNRRCA